VVFKLSGQTISLFIIVFLLFILTSCSLWKAEDKQLVMHINATPFLNPDRSGRSSPINLMIYQLKTPANFRRGTYSELVYHTGSFLGAELIDKTSKMIRPGSQSTVIQLLDSSAHYVGIIAAYRRLRRATWRRVFKVPKPSKRQLVLSIHLKSQSFGVEVLPIDNFLMHWFHRIFSNRQSSRVQWDKLKGASR
jgi:type VI secretion system protein VasD